MERQLGLADMTDVADLRAVTEAALQAVSEGAIAERFATTNSAIEGAAFALKGLVASARAEAADATQVVSTDLVALSGDISSLVRHVERQAESLVSERSLRSETVCAASAVAAHALAEAVDQWNANSASLEVRLCTDRLLNAVVDAAIEDANAALRIEVVALNTNQAAALGEKYEELRHDDFVLQHNQKALQDQLQVVPLPRPGFRSFASHNAFKGFD